MNVVTAEAFFFPHRPFISHSLRFWPILFNIPGAVLHIRPKLPSARTDQVRERAHVCAFVCVCRHLWVCAYTGP